MRRSVGDGSLFASVAHVEQVVEQVGNIEPVGAVAEAAKSAKATGGREATAA